MNQTINEPQAQRLLCTDCALPISIMEMPVVLKWGKRREHTFLGRPIEEALHSACDLRRKGKSPEALYAKANPKPIEADEVTARRKLAAAKAWETMRAKKQASA